MRVFPGQPDEDEDIVTPEEVEESLPEGFWDLPKSFIDSERIQAMYVALYKQLLEENPDRDVIELLRVERAAALYAYMRHLESSDGYDNTVNYRQLMSLWNTMVTDLRKTRSVNFDEAKIREEIAREYLDVINQAIRGFEPEIANSVRRRMLAELGMG